MDMNSVESHLGECRLEQKRCGRCVNAGLRVSSCPVVLFHWPCSQPESALAQCADVFVIVWPECSLEGLVFLMCFCLQFLCLVCFFVSSFVLPLVRSTLFLLTYRATPLMFLLWETSSESQGKRSLFCTERSTRGCPTFLSTRPYAFSW